MKSLKGNYVFEAIVRSDASYFVWFITEHAYSSNCFWENDLVFVDDRDDFTGNFTVVKDYELKAATKCDFLVDTKTKLKWQSDQFEASY